MITQETILERVMMLIVRFAPPGTPINPNTDLAQDLGMESIKVMDMLMELEDEFDISIHLNILMDVRTPKQLADAILNLMEHANGTL
ncbi:acyl carrier protein [Pseudomonas sp. WJP1]|jgi:acyl carrier protein|uniref:acyl carrier protein n=1 Tax=Pseudomonas sp. WJP1 TaxID=2986947 RepID=UPI0023497D38|nr:acyl carrier protein [Pseudomonas sp. WJP1]WCM54042.1 acyl carrier protein [Pseudomonas sp. WJP1]